MVDRVQLPQDPKIAGKIIDAEHEQASRRIERGMMGWLLGSGSEKPGNIAGFVVVVSFFLFGGLLIWGLDTPSLSKKDALLLVASFITLSLGYIFGRSTR